MSNKISEISWFKQLVFILIILITIFLILELFIRITFPKFNYNGISYEEDLNHRVFNGENTFLFSDKISDKFAIRVEKKKDNEIVETNKQKIIFIGDSVTLGLGVKFQDTYVENFKSNFKNDKIQILTFSNIGIDFNDIFYSINNEIDKILKKNDILIYQFNYNDITETKNSANLLQKNKAQTNKLILGFQKIKYKYLNYSSLIKFLNHYLSLMVKDTSGGCEDRKFDSLGQYTFAFFSKGFEEKSKTSWSRFQMKLLETKKLLDKKSIKFYILISPISLQLMNHKDSNKLNLDMKCSTKDGYVYLLNLIGKNNFEIIDPLMNFKNSEKKTLRQFFLPFDTNHPNNYGHKMIANEVYNKLSKYEK